MLEKFLFGDGGIVGSSFFVALLYLVFGSNDNTKKWIFICGAGVIALLIIMYMIKGI